ncbi:MAG: hypothetical protein AAF585_02055 [Verrucomicrobiota bacterium]
MDDRIANHLASYRACLASLDKPEHKTIWENQPPVIFTTKVGQARTLTNELADLAARQSAPITGSAADKKREEKELEDEAFKLGRALVGYAKDESDETLAAKYDLPISSWRRLRDEALLQKARQLQEDANTVATGADAANADLYGVNPDAVALLTKEADDYEAFIVAPQEAIADRSAMTASLPAKSRAVRAKFDELEDYLPQFQGTANGDAFVAAYLASTQIIDRGHGPGGDSGDEVAG